jgi:hypothetical protein
MVRARAIVAGQIRACKSEVDHAKRMVGLPPMVIVALEREEATTHAFRWVAWGATPTDQRRRSDLVIHLRRSIQRPRNGWFKDRHFVAALSAWDEARREARKRGGIPPTYDQIPLETYRAAVEGAQKLHRMRSPELETTATAGEESGELSAAEGEDDDNEEDGEDDDNEEDGEGIDEEPISTRQLQGRGHVLRHLSHAVRAALAANDTEAADVANDAISRLCGGRDDSE